MQTNNNTEGGKMKKAQIDSTVVANVCLYGNSAIGAGYLWDTKQGVRGGCGEPKKGRTFTEAVWGAVEEIAKTGVKRGLVRIFAPGGELFADADVRLVPAFGDMNWKRA